MPRFHQLDARAEALGIADLRARAYPKGLRFVAGCDAAGGIGHDGNDGNRPVAKPWLQFLFNRRKVGVQIEKEPAQTRLRGYIDMACIRHDLLSPFIRSKYSIRENTLGTIGIERNR